MTTSIFLKSTFVQSPIGHIPRDYPRIAQLLRIARVSCKDVSTVVFNKKTQQNETVEFRDWKIVCDEKPAMNKKGDIVGQGTGGHHKFCMLLDFIRHVFPEYNANQVYDESIDQLHPMCKKLMALNWQAMNDELARIGVHGYDTLKKKEEKNNSHSLPDL